MPQLTSSQLHDAVLDYFHETISRFPPPHAPSMMASPGTIEHLGDYLVDLGYLLPRELTRALYDWSHQTAPSPRPIGCLLVTRNIIPAHVLSSVLLLQSLDRFEQHAAPPRFLGERLLADGRITPEQLALVLEEQVLGYQHGTWTRLGELIVSHGWLDPSCLR